MCYNMKGTWDPDKRKYVKKKKEKKEYKWVHKNNYERTKWGLFKVGNKPYINPEKSKEKSN